MPDMSQIPTEDLKAIAAGDIGRVSTSTLRLLAGGREQAQERPAPYQYQEGDFLGNVGRGLGNVPHDAGQIVSGLASAVASPIQTGKSIGSLVLGMPGEVGKRLGADFEGSPVASQFLDTMKSQYWDNPAETLTERPLQSAMDVSSVLFPAAKAAGLGRVAQTATRMNPLAKAGEAASWAGRGASNLVAKIAPEAIALPTGAVPGSFRVAFEAGAKGGRELVEFKAATQGLRSAEDLANSVLDASDSLLSDAIREGTEKVKTLTLKSADDPLDLQRVRSDMFDVLKEYGIEPELKKVTVSELVMKKLPSGSVVDVKVVKRTENGGIALDFKGGKLELAKSERAAIQDMVDEVNKIIERGDNSIDQVHALRQAFDTIIKPNVTENNKYSNAVKVATRKRVRSQLGEKVDGYDEAMKGMEDAFSFNEELQQALGTAGKLEPMIGKLTSLLRDRPNLDRSKRLIEALEERTGTPFRSTIAGLELESIAPKGMLGHTFGAGLVVGGVFSPATLLYIPFVSPRVMGNLFKAMGIASREARKLTTILETIQGLLPPGTITEGLTVGEVIQRYGLESDMEPFFQ